MLQPDSNDSQPSRSSPPLSDFCSKYHTQFTNNDVTSSSLTTLLALLLVHQTLRYQLMLGLCTMVLSKKGHLYLIGAAQKANGFEIKILHILFEDWMQKKIFPFLLKKALWVMDKTSWSLHTLVLTEGQRNTLKFCFVDQLSYYQCNLTSICIH